MSYQYVLHYAANDFTITKYMGLYCDRQGQRDAIQSLLSIGSLVGLVVMNFVSDLRGRKFVLIIDLIVAVFGSLCTFLYIFSHYNRCICLKHWTFGFRFIFVWFQWILTCYRKLYHGRRYLLRFNETENKFAIECFLFVWAYYIFFYVQLDKLMVQCGVSFYAFPIYRFNNRVLDIG